MDDLEKVSVRRVSRCEVMIGRISVFFGIFIGFLMLMSGASAATAINSCGVISSPGIYELQNDIINSSATKCIEITSSDVIFDGKGLTIDGTGGFSYGIVVYNSTSTLTNVTVKNLTVTDWYYGIRYRLVDDGSISGINANSNDYGIYLWNSNNNILTDNNANSNGYGISLVSSNNSILTGNNADLNINIGIFLSSSYNNTVTGNTANTNNGTGVFLGDLSSSNTVTNNTANNNTDYGITYYSSTGNNLMNNIVGPNIQYGIVIYDSNSTWIYYNNVGSNGDDGITLLYSYDNIISGNTVLDNGYGGVYLNNSSNNTIIDNTVSGNSLEGISISFSSSYNTITSNTIFDNYWGIYFNVSSNNTIYNNYFSNTNNAYDNGMNDWNTTKTAGTNIVGGPYLGGNYYSDYTGSDADSDGIGDTPYTISGGSSVDYLPLIDTTPTITIISPQNTTYTDSSIGLNVSADEVIDTWWYSLNAGPNITFTPNTTIVGQEGSNTIVVYANDTTGNIGSSIRYFTTTTTPPPSNLTTFNISLLQGWNLISIPLTPENTSLDAVLASIEGNYTVVYRWADCLWKKSTAARNPLAEMTVEYGYWIDMTAPDTLELTGTQPALTTINVTNACWNLVGYPSLTSENLTTLLSPINYTVVYAYINGVWKKSTAARNPLTEMSPGYGYWVDANEAGSYEVRNNISQTTTFNISLLDGWNLISLPLTPENTSLDAVLASIEGNYTVVYRWADCIWKKSTAARNPLAEMTVEYGYWIDMTAPDTLELSGTEPALTTINVTNACWNLVGYPSLTSENLTTLLSPINYTVVYAYINGVWKKSTAARNPLTEMSPGYGYWIDANEVGSYEVGN